MRESEHLSILFQDNLSISSNSYPDLYLLDHIEPFTALSSLVKQVNDNTDAAILLLFNGSVVDTVTLYEMGIDGLVDSVENLMEIKARVAKLCGILEIKSNHRSDYYFNDCCLSPQTKQLICPDGSRITLDTNETLLFIALAENINSACHRDQLASALMKRRTVSNRTIDLTVHSLRAKMKKAKLPNMIQSIYGVGYMLCLITKD